MASKKKKKINELCWGAYHLPREAENFGLKSNVKAICYKFRSEIVEYLQRLVGRICKIPYHYARVTSNWIFPTNGKHPWSLILKERRSKKGLMYYFIQKIPFFKKYRIF